MFSQLSNENEEMKSQVITAVEFEAAIMTEQNWSTYFEDEQPKPAEVAKPVEEAKLSVFAQQRKANNWYGANIRLWQRQLAKPVEKAKPAGMPRLAGRSPSKRARSTQKRAAAWATAEVQWKNAKRER